MKMMKKTRNKKILTAIALLTAFAIWTALVRFVEVRQIGPHGTSVGLATLNRYVHALTGLNMTLYTVTDWLGLIPIATAMGFALLGLVQLIKRKSILRVDRDIIALGLFYVAVALIFVLFETVIINYRPVLIDGRIEASYPSSTTMLVGCVMPTALIRLRARIKHRRIKLCITVATLTFTVFMILGRLLSGVHWITDIIGGAILSAGLVLLYDAVCDIINNNQ